MCMYVCMCILYLLKVNDARAVAFIILSLPHTHTPTHPHTLTVLQDSEAEGS